MYLCGLRDAARGTGAAHSIDVLKRPQYGCERYVFVPRVLLELSYFHYGFPRHRDHRLRYESNPRTTRAHFTGSIPPEIGALVALKDLDLSATNIEGASILYDRKHAYFKLWFVQAP
jgi:hypothetical protein